MNISKRERFIKSKCDRCGKATAAKQNGTGDLFVLPHEWPAPLGDLGAFCQKCIEKFDQANWRNWFDNSASPPPNTIIQKPLKPNPGGS